MSTFTTFIQFKAENPSWRINTQEKKLTVLAFEKRTSDFQFTDDTMLFSKTQQQQQEKTNKTN